jgi:hypothetical protein
MASIEMAMGRRCEWLLRHTLPECGYIAASTGRCGTQDHATYIAKPPTCRICSTNASKAADTLDAVVYCIAIIIHRWLQRIIVILPGNIQHL